MNSCQAVASEVRLPMEYAVGAVLVSCRDDAAASNNRVSRYVMDEIAVGAAVDDAAASNLLLTRATSGTDDPEWYAVAVVPSHCRADAPASHLVPTHARTGADVRSDALTRVFSRSETGFNFPDAVALTVAPSSPMSGGAGDAGRGAT